MVAAESDGERVIYRLLSPGERVMLEGERVIALRLGNAGSVTLSINDGPRRSPGRDGQVVELELTPEQLAELDRRWMEHQQNPDSAVPWAEVRRKLLG